MTQNKLYRSETDRMIAGVCGGFAEVYELDPSLVRLLTAFIILLTFPIGLVIYILAWLIIPEETEI